MRRITLLVLASFALWQTAFAVPIPIDVSSSGVFGGVCSGGGSTCQGLHFDDDTFIGAIPPDLTINLGEFTLDPDPATYSNVPFLLTLFFDAPPGVGGQPFSAQVFGTVIAQFGLVKVDFNNTPKLMTPDSPFQSFRVWVDDVILADPLGGNQVTAPLKIHLSVPEPAAFEALGAGLVGVILLLRRRSLALGGLAAR